MASCCACDGLKPAHCSIGPNSFDRLHANGRTSSTLRHRGEPNRFSANSLKARGQVCSHRVCGAHGPLCGSGPCPRMGPRRWSSLASRHNKTQSGATRKLSSRFRVGGFPPPYRYCTRLLSWERIHSRAFAVAPHNSSRTRPLPPESSTAHAARYPGGARPFLIPVIASRRVTRYGARVFLSGVPPKARIKREAGAFKRTIPALPPQR